MNEIDEIIEKPITFDNIINYLGLLADEFDEFKDNSIAGVNDKFIDYIFAYRKKIIYRNGEI